MTITTRTARPHARTSRGHAQGDSARVIEVTVLALVCLAVGLVIAMPRAIPEASVTRPVRVHTGETLWELAARYPLSGATTAETVDAIRRVNDLEGSRLVAGSVILVPVSSAPASLSAKR